MLLFAFVCGENPLTTSGTDGSSLELFVYEAINLDDSPCVYLGFWCCQNSIICVTGMRACAKLLHKSPFECWVDSSYRTAVLWEAFPQRCGFGWDWVDFLCRGLYGAVFWILHKISVDHRYLTALRCVLLLLTVSMQLWVALSAFSQVFTSLWCLGHLTDRGGL